MKWKIIISKGDEVKEGTIEITSNPQAVGKIIEAHGWKVDYLVPISDMLDDEDTQIIEIGGLSNANAI